MVEFSRRDSLSALQIKVGPKGVLIRTLMSTIQYRRKVSGQQQLNGEKLDLLFFYYY